VYALERDSLFLAAMPKGFSLSLFLFPGAFFACKPIGSEEKLLAVSRGHGVLGCCLHEQWIE
jgi:hypothetical protein